MHTEKLQPGQEVDRQAIRRTVNELIDQAERSQLTSAVGTSIQDGPEGMGLVPDVSIKPVWGELTRKSPDNAPDHYFEWKQVDKAPDGKWQRYDNEKYLGYEDYHKGYGSSIHHNQPEKATLYDPAVELNGCAVPIGSIVRLYPTELVTDEYDNTHRLWVFSFRKLRPFELTQALCPTGRVNNTDTQLEAADVENGSFLPDVPRETEVGVWWLDTGENGGRREEHIYAQHKQGRPAGDQFFNLGYAPSSDPLGGHARATRGWASYEPHATILRYDRDDDPVWRGEWQIVSLEAQQIVQVVLMETILPGEFGQGRGMEGLIAGRAQIGIGLPATEQIWIYNDLPFEMTIGSIHNVHFNKMMYIWLPVTPVATPHGRTVYGSGSLDVVDDNFVTIPIQNTLAHYGIEVQPGGQGLKNVGPLSLVGTASWTVTAHRVINVAATDLDSRLEVALFNNGIRVAGTTSGMTSSRRWFNADGEGVNATNSISESVIQVLASGATLTIGARIQNKADNFDIWRTVGSQCNLTFKSISSFIQKEAPVP